MANEGLQLKAVARVRLTKLDEAGNVISVEEQDVELSEKEVKELWHSQMQA